MARSYLHQIHIAEAQYKEDYGTFRAMHDLARFYASKELAARLHEDDFPYEFTITADGETFSATARHKTRPETRKAFIVGPDGEVKELKPEEPSGQ